MEEEWKLQAVFSQPSNSRWNKRKPALEIFRRPQLISSATKSSILLPLAEFTP